MIVVFVVGDAANEVIGDKFGMTELSEAFTAMTTELKELREGSAARDIVIKAMFPQRTNDYT